MISSENIQTSPKRSMIHDDIDDDHYSTDDMRDGLCSPALLDHNISGSPSASLRKRSRTVLTPFQTRYLQSVLEKTYFPTQIQRDEISRAINVPSRTVQIWFQNQRQKAKQLQIQQKASGDGAHHKQSLQNLLNMPQKDFQVTLQQMLQQMGQSRAQEIRDMAQNLYHISNLSQMTPAMFLNILHIQQQGVPAPSLFQQQKTYKPSPFYRDCGSDLGNSRMHIDTNGYNSPCKSLQLPPPRLFSPLSAPSIPGGGFHDELPSLRSLVAAALTCVPSWEHQSQDYSDWDSEQHSSYNDLNGLNILVNAAIKSEKRSSSPDYLDPRHQISPNTAQVPSISPKSFHNLTQRSPYQRPLKLKSPEMSRKNEEYILAKTAIPNNIKYEEPRDSSDKKNEMMLTQTEKSMVPHGGASSTCYLSPESGLDQHGESTNIHLLPTFSPDDIRAVYSEPCSPRRMSGYSSPDPEEHCELSTKHYPPRARTPYDPHRLSKHRYQKRSITLLAPL